jgi:hypothetical protein
MTKSFGCKLKWMMLSLQLLKAKGQCDKFSVVEVDGVLWLFFCNPKCLVAGYERCGVYDWRRACCVWCSSWVSSMVHYVLEEVLCLMLMKVRWCGSDKREDIKIWHR